MMKNAYEQLTDHFQKISDLQHVYAMTSWDEAANMPVGGGAARGQAMATLGVMVHELSTAPEIRDWLDASSNLPLDQWQSANLREIQREYESAICLPADLVRANSLATSQCEQGWRQARAENDWQGVQPALTEVVARARDIASVRSEATGLSPYDAMLEQFEPGMQSARIDELFAGLKSFLPDFVSAALEFQATQNSLPLIAEFPIEKQRALGLKVMSALGFDFDHGRLDVSHHPFCGGVPEDVRITTRYSTDSFVESLMAVVHETGHALYEQGRPKAYAGQPVSEARSSGVHESQSLLMEMQAGRSLEFVSFLTPLIQDAFSADPGDPAWSAENLYRHYTRIDRGLIRVDADEATYPLHVILRYEIEKQLIGGEIEVSHIPAAWDEKMMAFLARDTQGDYRDGCMQDVHWFAGLFGYFPTYTLGAMMAAQQFATAKRQIPDLLETLASGDVSKLLSWVRQNIHSRGSLLSVSDLMIEATGQDLNEQFFVDHLRARYLPAA